MNPNLHNLTYTTRIAHQLREMGAQPGRLVGVCLERSPDLVATLLAILKSGAAYVPLDPSYPADRTAYVLGDAGATVLVSEDRVVKDLGAIPCRVLSLDGDAGRIEQRAATRPEPLAGPEDLAYVIYTSGSTGRPKGVQIEHRAVGNFVQSMAERPGLGPDDVLLAVTTAAFDIAVLELFLPMYVGARIVLASRETARDPDALQLALRQQGVTVMQATPATWRMLRGRMVRVAQSQGTVRRGSIAPGPGRATSAQMRSALEHVWAHRNDGVVHLRPDRGRCHHSYRHAHREHPGLHCG